VRIVRWPGDAGREDLAAAGVAGHEVRLDQARQDPHVGLDEGPVEGDRRARRGDPQVDQARLVAGHVVDHPHAREDLVVADDPAQLLAQVGPVEARGHQDRDGLGRHARGAQPAEDRRSSRPLGTGR
jgi:hypothetical protein